ncbi:alpha/beta fold hydrolase [Phycicoccus sp. Soil748]|uniref:alpha/beta fold hydrolase n=1 Tax=Intrasporangiaceae TaxID=85021 RepID=UPI0007030136|nr:alpha/beta fold hydrolase [Phycicoccus sp. Soil748]KRE56464.1 alpha/beta hydrolase [Phycicoccus sp. Soil748]
MEHFNRDGLTFDVTDAGPSGGPADRPVAVLLHGWPQDRSAWAPVTSRLVAQGVRVLAPDQRGYSPGARPRGAAAYRMSQLVADVLALVDASGAPRVHLVGHDWGGAVAWAFAERHPDRLHSLTVASTPHPDAMAWALRHGDQALKSWYMLAFQVPVLPEAFLRRRLPSVLRGTGLPPEQVQRYVARFREPGAASGGLAWYRALRPRLPRLQPSDLHPSHLWARLAGGAKGHGPDHGFASPVRVPTTYLWGRHDPALGRAAAERTARCVGPDYRFVELDAGHWLPESHPDEVAAAVLDRVRATPQG